MPNLHQVICKLPMRKHSPSFSSRHTGGGAKRQASYRRIDRGRALMGELRRSATERLYSHRSVSTAICLDGGIHSGGSDLSSSASCLTGLGASDGPVIVLLLATPIRQHNHRENVLWNIKLYGIAYAMRQFNVRKCGSVCVPILAPRP